MRFTTIVFCPECGAEVPRGHPDYAPPTDISGPCVRCGSPDVRLIHTSIDRRRESLGVATPSLSPMSSLNGGYTSVMSDA